MPGLCNQAETCEDYPKVDGRGCYCNGCFDHTRQNTLDPIAVHLQSKNNLTFECLSEKTAGSKATTHIGQVTCLDCLRALITSRVPEHMVMDTELHCGECGNLNLTEAEQDILFAESGIKPQHQCARFKSQIFHAFPFEGNLLRHSSCNLCRGFEAR